MDLRSGHPFWQIKNGLSASHPALHRDEKCDVANIGGGVTDVQSTARVLHRH